MNWKKVKTIIIVILLVVNLFFVYNIYIQYKNIYLIDKKSINTTVELLEQNNIIISADIIPEKKLTANIYECRFDENYYKVITKIMGTENYSKNIISNGIQFISNDHGDIFEFYNILNVKYYKNSDEKIDDKYIEEVKNELSGLSSLLSVRPVNNNYLKLISGFLFPDSNKNNRRANKSNIEISGMLYDDKKSRYIVSCYQTLENYKIEQCEFFVIIKNDLILYIEGMIIFDLFENDNTDQFCDQLNILFLEKSYIDEYKRNIVSEDDIYKIISFMPEYCIIWYTEKNIFYLVPAWRIGYSDGTVRIRNAIDGNIYL